MLDEIGRAISNAIYFVPLQVRRYKAKEPDATVLAAGATKAQKSDRENEPQYEAGLGESIRAVLR